MVKRRGVRDGKRGREGGGEGKGRERGMRAGKEGGEEGGMVKGGVSEMACCQLSTPEEHGDGICKEPGVVHSPH